ncbi:MAG: hypothetical protein CVU97_01475 [Firmicutes bacterium HGW-Firmicutes-21]|nr:MAG: hypothetical protein CVU97_01475 [Firmicutes bacterium HGW-Firmicutes-21]
MHKKIEYFAGVNTKNGFTSYYQEIIGNKYKKVYILKGSAGCGKSTFIKRVGERALRDGLSVEYIRCSADSRSFDGVLLPEKGIAVIDGTAPHIMNMKYPSARENIINLGDFWDEAKIKLRREELIALTDRKNVCYENAYRALSAAGSIRELRNILISSVTLEEKMKSFAGRICKKLLKPTSGNADIRIQTAFNQNGMDYLPTYSFAENVYLIKDRYDIAYRFLDMVRAYAERIGADRIISFDPVDTKKLEAIYFPNEDILFSAERHYKQSGTKKSENKPINTLRFIDKNGIKAIRQKDRAAFKLYNALLDSAKQFFAEASRVHDSIERIYIRSMDFVKLTDYTNKFIGELFG